MTISITVHPQWSPRIIEVPSPTTDVTVQELVDAVRAWEDSDIGINYPYLIDAAGKEELGGGVVVGITATLQNARVMFTGRYTPLDNGVGRTCDLTDSLGTHLHVDDADFITDGIYEGCTVFNTTTGDMAVVLQIVDLHNIISFPLAGYGGSGWTAGDSYSIYPNELCTIAGGNLVAVDNAGIPIDAVLQSPNVQIVKSSSSSATLQELGAVQYSSFNGGVTIDETNGTEGTSFPIGTVESPVNNLTDAMTIAGERGFNVLFIKGDITVDSSGDFSEMMFVGESVTKSTFTVSTLANVLNCEFYEATVTGTLDGNAKLKNCRILDLTYVYGVIEECLLGPGTIVLGGTNAAHFLNCWSGVAGASAPVVDCGGSGQELALRNYNGGLAIINKTGVDEVSIDLNSGYITLDSTVTAGNIVIRGIGKLTDNSVGASVYSDDLLNREQITKPGWGSVYIDTVSGAAGTAFPLGTAGSPVDNITDARLIADANNIKSYIITGSVTLDQAYDNWAFIGNGSLLSDTVLLNGQSIEKTRFSKLSISGVIAGTNVQYERCNLSNVYNMNGLLVDCGIAGTIGLAGMGSMLIGQNVGAASATIDMIGFGRIVQMSCKGDMIYTNAGAGSILQLGIEAGSIVLDSSCTGGLATFTGTSGLTDNSSMTVTNNLVNKEMISEAAWDEPTSEHTTPGTFGGDGVGGGGGPSATEIDNKLTEEHGEGSWNNTYYEAEGE